ncbi:HD-GYP domain-containing protein [Bythopirellula polymerisocia]|uniref:Cyclic di-GMP phosphodiesterase response regulator RpfG n=1 Tax=Bythopirellula polymerisocia TaxID=2528003 RepID=A0A5C6CIN9_9BACT|nr:HD-GYP domain-containing protein [Bythopirellula polymerisocia]TWU22619.1 Cyclic di-GMP phosphodiesterase response regulator RpfG [Bythopirellula polymerisocia]
MAIGLEEKTSRTANPAQRKFICIPISVFQVNQNSQVDLYLKIEGNQSPVLYRSAAIPISSRDIEELRRNGHRALCVASSDFSRLDRALNESLHEVLANQEIPPAERFAILQTAAAMEMDIAFHMIKCDRIVTMSQRIAKHITSLLNGEHLVPQQLFAVVQHDYYTYTHVINVAGFATLLADLLGFSDPKLKEQITIGALLHDIGKRFIPSSVLCKENKLTEEEWQLIKSHPQRGFEDLCERIDLTQEQLLMVYEHHERFDGKGYPVGLVGEEIHTWARLLAVVDVFDAVTSARPYRKPMSLSQSLNYLESNSGSHFDPEMVQCWVSAMKLT